MWPDSLMHTRVSNQGNGATRGKAAWLCGGSYIAKLVIKGLVNQDGKRYPTVTDKAKTLLHKLKMDNATNLRVPSSLL